MTVSRDEDRAVLPPEGPAVGAPEPTGGQLWPDDAGTLLASSRRALVQLVRGPYLSAARHGALWGALLNDEPAIRSRLADLFLDLVVDADHEVAFVRNVDQPEVDAPRVVRTAPMTFLDTAMLLHLRQTLLAAGAGERVIVGQDELAEQLEVYRSASSTDAAGFAKRVNASWVKLQKYGILATTTTEGRCEVSPVLRLVFGPEQISAVRAEYARLAAPPDEPTDEAAGVGDDAHDDDHDDEERP